MKTKIYLVSNIDNNPNKIYIGKTKNSREKDHRRSFGNQIIYKYIDEIDSLNSKDWKPLETKWIQYYMGLGYILINKQKIGGSGVEFHSKETKQKMSLSKTNRKITWGDKISKANKGRKHSEETKQKISQSNKGKKYSEERNQKLRKPKSEETKQKISQAKLGKLKSDSYKQKISIIKSKPILQYDLQNNFIKEWSSATEAGKFLNKKNSAISECCNNKRKSAYNFIWKFKN
jgi:group I intron endonuclease